MPLTRRDFVTALSASVTALALPVAVRADDGVLFAPTADDGLADAIQQALTAGVRRLHLGDGSYGPQTVRGIRADGLEIVGTGSSSMNMTMIAASSGLRFRNITFQGERSERGSGQGLVYVNRDASDVHFAECQFRAVEDTSGWSPTDWVERPYNSGLLARGPGVKVRKSTFSNLRVIPPFLTGPISRI